MLFPKKLLPFTSAARGDHRRRDCDVAGAGMETECRGVSRRENGFPSRHPFRCQPATGQNRGSGGFACDAAGDATDGTAKKAAGPGQYHVVAGGARSLAAVRLESLRSFAGRFGHHGRRHDDRGRLFSPSRQFAPSPQRTTNAGFALSIAYPGAHGAGRSWFCRADHDHLQCLCLRNQRHWRGMGNDPAWTSRSGLDRRV